MRFLFALLLLAGLGGTALAVSDPAELMHNPAQEARAEQIGRQLRCLVCQNEDIEDSGADLARDLRRIVRVQVAEGRTNRQIMDWMVAPLWQLRPAGAADDGGDAAAVGNAGAGLAGGVRRGGGRVEAGAGTGAGAADGS